MAVCLDMDQGGVPYRACLAAQSEAALIERDSNTFIPAPDDMTGPLEMVAWHVEGEVIWDEERGDDFKSRASL